jgi:hypothetical protein
VRVVRAGGCAAAAGAKVLRADCRWAAWKAETDYRRARNETQGRADFDAEAEAEPPGGLYCAWCGKAIEPRRRRRESFCGANCRAAAWKARTGWKGLCGRLTGRSWRYGCPESRDGRRARCWVSWPRFEVARGDGGAAAEQAEQIQQGVGGLRQGDGGDALRGVRASAASAAL